MIVGAACRTRRRPFALAHALVLVALAALPRAHAAENSRTLEGAGVRARFSSEGISIGPSTGPDWRVDLALERFGRLRDTVAVPSPDPDAKGQGFAYDRSPEFSEAWEASPAGLRIALTLPGAPRPASPASEGSLPVEFVYALRTPLVARLSDDGRTIEFLSGGEPVARLGEILGRDADGREAPVRFQLVFSANQGEPAAIRILADVMESAFPVTLEAELGAAGGEKQSVLPGGSGLPEKPSLEGAGEGAGGGSVILAAPANDTCSGAVVVPAAGPFPYLTATVANITDATTTGDPTAPSCQPSVARGLWYKFTPSVSAQYTLSVCADGPTATTVDDTVLAVYTSSNNACNGTLTQVVNGCNDDGCNVEGLQSMIQDLSLTAGVAYFVLVNQYGGAGAPSPGNTAVQLRVEQFVPPAAPANDACAGATVIPDGPYDVLTATTADITGANVTGDPPAPSCQTQVSRSIWYTFTPSMTAEYTFSSCADAPTGTTVDDTVIGIYTSSNGACGGTFTEAAYACDDDSCTTEDLQAVVRTVLSAGTKYFVLVWKGGTTQRPTAGNTAVQLRVSRRTLTPPANDSCPGAQVIPAAGPFPLNTALIDLRDATLIAEPGVPSCQASVSRSVWYRFAPSSSGYYTFSSCAGAPTGTTVDDTVLGVYTSAGSCAGPFTEVPSALCQDGCDDDTCSVNERQSVITSWLVSGTTYYVLAWKFSDAPPATGASLIQLRVSRETPPAAPANDSCAAAEVIPASGPFPHTSALVADLRGATCTGDPPAPSCAPSTSRSLWYTFTPTTSTSYTLSSCADAPTGTTVDDTVLAVYTSTGGCAGPFTQLGCDGDACGSETLQSVITNLGLSAGTTYYIVLSEQGTIPPTVGNTAAQLKVSQPPAPANDRCSGATALALDTPVSGTTVSTTNDYQLSGSACFTGVGQNASTAIGRDAVFSFTAPTAGSYSFRVTGYQTDSNLVLFTSSACEGGTPPITLASCLAASNRNGAGSSEEVMCQTLALGQKVWLTVDENTITGGSNFTVEATRCDRETEANGTPATANALVCGKEGSITPNGDADFFSLGTVPSLSRVFVMTDGIAGNSNDFDMRFTTSVDTLEFDDVDNDTPFGNLAPNLGGARGTGVAGYLRVNHHSATLSAEPYRLYPVVQPPSGSATAETEPNNTTGQAALVPGADFISGSLPGPAPSADVDVYQFQATAGTLIVLGVDGDPVRDGTPVNAKLELRDPSGATLVTVNDPTATSSTVSGAGSLTATTPNSPAEGIVWRARVTGTYSAVVSIGTSSTGATGAGDYLLSIAPNCLPADADGDGMPNARDCAMQDAGTRQAPDVVTNLTVARAGGGTITVGWTSQDPVAGSATRYDVARGLVSTLRTTGWPGGATCAGNDVADTPYTEGAGACPASAGDGCWYLVRAVNSCATATYGVAALDAASPCTP